MTTIKVKFRPSTVVGRPGSIVYLITCHRVVRQITSEYKVFPEEWDEERSTVLLGHTERTDIRAISRKLRDDIARLKVVIEGLNSRQTRFTADDVVEKFHEVTADSSFFRFMQKFI